MVCKKISRNCFQPQCYAPCCIPGHVTLKQNLDFINGNVVNKAELLKQKESEIMRKTRLLISNHFEDVDGLVSTYFEAAEDHHFNPLEGDEADAYNWELEDETWVEDLFCPVRQKPEELDNEKDLFSQDTRGPEEIDTHSHSRVYKSSFLPPGSRIVHDYQDGRLQVWHKSADETMELAAQFSSLRTVKEQVRSVSIQCDPNLNNNNNDQQKNLEADIKTISITNRGESVTSIVDAFPIVNIPKKCKDEVVNTQEEPTPNSDKGKSSAMKRVRGGRKVFSTERPQEGLAKCQPCDIKFPVNDITNHMVENHGSKNNKLRSCTFCKDNIFMTVHYFRKHMEIEHPDVPKGQRKGPSLSSTPNSASRKKKDLESTPVSDYIPLPDHSNAADLNVSLNSSAENLDKITEFLNRTAPANVAVEPGEVVPRKKRGRPPLAESEKKKRSRSLGGAKARPSPKKRKTQRKKSKETPLKPKMSDNDPNHPTSSVSLRKNRVHSHDSSKECSMNCSLSPNKSLPFSQEYKVDTIKDLSNKIPTPSQKTGKVNSVHARKPSEAKK